MKGLLAIGLGVAVYVALGVTLGFTRYTLFTIPALGSIGAFTVKGVAGFLTTCCTYARLK
jgi:hypothetical protein